MNTESVRVAGRAAAALMLITLLSRILGFLRESFLAAYFGSNWQTDAFFIANVIPLVLFQAAATGVFTNFIPLMVRLENTAGRAAAQDFIDNVGAFLTLALGAVGLFIWIAAPQLTVWIAPGFDPEAHTLAITLTRLLVPSMIFQGLTSYFGAVLNARHQFVGATLVFLLYNLGVILSIVIAGPRWGLVGVTMATNLITLVQALLTGWLVIRAGYRLGWRPPRLDAHLRRLGVLATPTIIASITAQVNVVIDRILASGLPQGSVSALSFADRINGLPVYMFAIPIATVALPAISEIASKRGRDASAHIAHRLSHDLRKATFWVLPTSIAFIVLSEPVTALLLERGAFTAESTQLTAATLACFSLGSVFWGWREILLKAFFALGKTRLPMYASLVTVIVNAALSLVLGPIMGAPGLSLAFSLSMMANSAWLLWGMQGELQSHAWVTRQWWPRLLGAGAALALLLTVMKHVLPGGNLFLLVASAVIGGGTFVVMSALLGIDDAKQLWHPIRQRIQGGRDLLRQRLNLLISLAIVLSLALATVGYTPSDQTALTWLQLPRLGMYALTAFLVLVATCLNPTRPGRRLLLPAAAVVGWACVSLTAHGTPLTELVRLGWLSSVLNIVWFGVAVLWFAQQDDPLASLKRILAVVGCVLMLEGLVSYLFVPSYGEFVERNPAWIGNPNGYAYLLLLTAPAVWDAASARRAYLFTASLTLQTLLLLSTGSRGALLVLGFALCIRLFQFLRAARLKDMLPVVSGALIGAALWFWGTAALPKMTIQANDVIAPSMESDGLVFELESSEHQAGPDHSVFLREEKDNVSRWVLTVAGFRVMTENPLFGIGVDTLGYHLEEQVRRLRPAQAFEPFRPSDTSHGVFPTLGAMFGVPAAVAALWLFGTMAVWLARLVLGRPGGSHREFLISTLAIVLPYFLFEDKFFLGSGALGAFFWAILGGLNEIERSEHKGE